MNRSTRVIYWLWGLQEATVGFKNCGVLQPDLYADWWSNHSQITLKNSTRWNHILPSTNLENSINWNGEMLIEMSGRKIMAYKHIICSTAVYKSKSSFIHLLTCFNAILYKIFSFYAFLLLKTFKHMYQGNHTCMWNMKQAKKWFK